MPGAVRNFVSAEELEAWAEALRECNMHLQILRGSSDEYRPDADELELCGVHLWLCAEEIAEREAWLRQRVEEEQAERMKQIEEERAAARASAELRAQQRWSCQLICDNPRVKRDIRVGDMIRRDAGDREVAIVSRLATLATSGPSIPTGDCDLLLWNASDKEWSTPMFDVPLSTLDLLPLCCSRARCTVLLQPPYNLCSERQEMLVSACRQLRCPWKRVRKRFEGNVEHLAEVHETASDADDASDEEIEIDTTGPDPTDCGASDEGGESGESDCVGESDGVSDGVNESSTSGDEMDCYSEYDSSAVCSSEGEGVEPAVSKLASQGPARSDKILHVHDSE